MKSHTVDVPHATSSSQAISQTARQNSRSAASTTATRISRQQAQQILISLMLPAIVMPITSSMSRVALPAIRDQFQLAADTTAWINTAFMLPFMVLMPVYGRLSDGVGKRRLILGGLVIFSIGTAMTLLSTDLAWLMVGRAVQGLGSAGLMPLGMAFISSIFGVEERGKALGTWSTIGPTTAFLGPLAAGFLVEGWGWRAAYGPPLLASILAFVVVARFVPAGLSRVIPRFWRLFDWLGVVLLSSALVCFLFYLSSRPITGVTPLQDWRLLAATILLMGTFLWWERRHHNPFVALDLFRRRLFTTASLCASMRMVTMAGSGFLIPLYLVDVHNLKTSAIGMMLMITPGVMAVVVRFGGQVADRWGSRPPTLIGLSIQALVMVLLSQLPATAPLWHVGALLVFQGLGVGIMLAALHRAAMGKVSEVEMGAAAGLYSMIRYAGMAIGAALAGVLLQNFLDLNLPVVEAYQGVFLFLASFSAIGIVISFAMRE